MERTLRTKRLYWLGDYRNIEFEDILEGIPSEQVLNGEYVSNIRYLQLVTIELAYRRYANLVTKYPHSMAFDEAIKALEEEREAALITIKQSLNGNPQET